WLEEYWPLWRDRAILRGNLSYVIQMLRNRALGIHSYTKRPVAPQVYAEKFKVLGKMLQSAQSKGVKVLLYIPPYRSDISGPYDKERYAQFKADLKSLADLYQMHYSDLDNTVPG